QLLAVHQPTIEGEAPTMTKTSEKALPVENQTWSGKARGAKVTKTNSGESCLIYRVLNGGVEGFYELVRPYERAIFLAAWSLGRNGARAKYRAGFVLREMQQLSIAETAQVLGISEASVKTRLSRARLKMRDALAT